MQVAHNGGHASCCAVVRGMQRNLFVVPREEVGSQEITQLEAEAATSPEAGKKLIPLLHVRLSGRGRGPRGAWAHCCCCCFLGPGREAGTVRGGVPAERACTKGAA